VEKGKSATSEREVEKCIVGIIACRLCCCLSNTVMKNLNCAKFNKELSMSKKEAETLPKS
jgi:hypothetical protein